MRRWIAVVMMLAGAAGTAEAQDAGRIGIAMGYPASIGVVWRLSDRVALRPELSLTQSTTDSTAVLTIGTPAGLTTSTSQTTSDLWTVGVGASALLYVNRWDALRTYVSPRFLYTRTSVSNGGVSAYSPATGVQTTTSEFVQTGYFVSGSFGAEYGLGRRFAAFGEVGFGYAHNESSSPQNGAGNSTGHTVATRSGAGVIVYF